MEEWNEFGELKENIGPVPANNAAPAGGRAGVQTAPPLSHNTTPTSTSSKSVPASKPAQPVFDKSKAVALPGAAEIAARNKAKVEAAKTEPQTSPVEEKKSSDVTTQNVTNTHRAQDHLSAPASRTQSGSATPAQTEETSTVEGKEQHSGSQVLIADIEGVRKIENSFSLQEEPNQDEAEDQGKEELTAEKGISELKVNDDDYEKPTQEQDAKEPEDAGKSVAD